MKGTKISSSNLNQVRASMQSNSYEPTSGDAPAKGSKDNPYTWDEYCTMMDSTEPLSSSFYFRNEDDEMRFSMAGVVIKYDGSSDYSGESDYDGSSDYQGMSGVYNLSNPDSGTSLLEVLYDNYSGAIGSFLETIGDNMGDAGTFPIAVSNYYSGSPVDLTLNINSLGLNCLTKDIFRKHHNHRDPQIGDKIRINLSDTDVISDVIKQTESISDITCYISTALSIGTITFTCVNTDEYEILDYDTYNFDWKKVEGDDNQKWKILKRNFVTILGKIINEGICISMDDFFFGPLGILLGIKNRNITGTTEFRIYFTGKLKIKR
ncbi:MAG: hypothetical protein J5630_05410 [Bacteroidaceae bacterium]|nr:hypothetical protein [Bacteroidaceae bacterium]